MRIRGLHYTEVIAIASDLDMRTRQVRELNGELAFKLANAHTATYYSRKSVSGRRVRAVCFHGWRDFIRVCFVNGATRIRTTQGSWSDVDAFDRDLARIAAVNVGSVIAPRTMPELCTHMGRLPNLLRRAVNAARMTTPSSEAVA